jgi:hypothetical protein
MESAEQQLAKLWDKDSDRNAITQSADLLDASLARNPYVGESRPEEKYVAFALPLGVSYEIDAEHNRVRVLSVWKVSKKPKRQ